MYRENRASIYFDSRKKLISGILILRKIKTISLIGFHSILKANRMERKTKVVHSLDNLDSRQDGDLKRMFKERDFVPVVVVVHLRLRALERWLR